MLSDPFCVWPIKGKVISWALMSRAGRIAFGPLLRMTTLITTPLRMILESPLDAETEFLLRVAGPLRSSAPIVPGGAVATPWCQEVGTGPYDRRAHVKIQPRWKPGWWKQLKEEKCRGCWPCRPGGDERLQRRLLPKLRAEGNEVQHD